MDALNHLPQALARAVQRALRPLCRVLLHHGMSYPAFEALARQVYVDVAIREFGLPGKKPSISRASILSGLSRKDVQRLLTQGGAAAGTVGPVHDNRAARVLAAWWRDVDFVDAAGHPRALDVADKAAGFPALVRRHSGDMPARAVLDELIRQGAVQRNGDGALEVVATAFVPRRSAVDKLELLGTDLADLATTIDHNIRHGDDDPRFQRKVMYQDMSPAVVQAFRKLSSERAMALLVQLDHWLAARADQPIPPGEAPVRLGLAIHYFEDRVSPGSPARQQPCIKEN